MDNVDKKYYSGAFKRASVHDHYVLYATIEEKEKRGWERRDILRYLFLLEEVCPEIEEDAALAKMQELNAKYNDRNNHIPTRNNV
jgi:hypothetical protein